MKGRWMNGYLYHAHQTYGRGKKDRQTNPKRIKDVNREIEAMGVKILDQYALM
jgi:uncharacterized protein with GYD domain